MATATLVSTKASPVDSALIGKTLLTNVGVTDDLSARGDDDEATLPLKIVAGDRFDDDRGAMDVDIDDTTLEQAHLLPQSAWDDESASLVDPGSHTMTIPS
jgi:hypothetical protein